MRTRPLRQRDPEEVGGYRPKAVIGEGGQGVVYLAETRDGVQVAVKVMHPHLAEDEQARTRFLREAEAAREVGEFCTARVLDTGISDDGPYIVSEYIEGETLQNLVIREGPRTPADLQRLAIGTAAALAAIHKAGLAHRDFKPHNVLMAQDGPRVIDFGIAKAPGNALVTDGVLGTPAYTAPEQASGGKAVFASDVFSWASTMVFAATGQPPFGQDDLYAVLNRITNFDPDLKDIPPALRDVIAAAFAKDPAKRPAAMDLLVRLKAAQAPPSKSRRLFLIGGAAALLIPPVAWKLTKKDGIDLRVLEPHGGVVASLGTGNVKGRPTISALFQDAKLRTFELTTGKRVSELATGIEVRFIPEQESYRTLDFGTAKGKQVYVSVGGPWPKVWNLATGTALDCGLTQEANWKGGVWTDNSAFVCATDIGKALHAVFAKDGRIIIRNAEQGTPAYEAIKVHDGEFDAQPARSSDDKALLVTTGLDDQQIKVWDLTTSKQVGKTLPNPSGFYVLGLISHPTGQWLATTAAAGRAITLWNLETGERTATDANGDYWGVTGGNVRGIPVLATADRKDTIQLWNLRTGKPLGTPLTGHSGRITVLALKDDLLVSGSTDGTIRRWKV